MKPAVKNSFPSLSNFFNDDLFFSNFMSADKYPAVNVKESDSGYALEVVAPGIKKDGFKLEVDDNVLTISGEASTETEKETKKVYRREYSFESFSRQFILPDHVDHDKISAEHKDGVLEINLPKIQKSSAKTKKSVSIN